MEFKLNNVSFLICPLTETEEIVPYIFRYILNVFHIMFLALFYSSPTLPCFVALKHYLIL